MPDTVAGGEYGLSCILQQVPDCDTHEAGMTWKDETRFLIKHPGRPDPYAVSQCYIQWFSDTGGFFALQRQVFVQGVSCLQAQGWFGPDKSVPKVNALPGRGRDAGMKRDAMPLVVVFLQKLSDVNITFSA